MQKSKKLRNYKSLCAFSAIIIYLLSSCSSNDDLITRKSHESLGTIINISIYGNSSPEMFSESFAIVDNIHQLMSLQVRDSDLSRLNAMAGISPVQVDPLTLEVIDEAVRIAGNSNSAFTPLIQPLVALWDIGGDNPRVPDPEEIESAIHVISIENLEIERPAANEGNASVFLSREGMGIDLGGIAKGFAADLVKEHLENAGVTRAILDFGGNIVTIGSKSEDKSWTIGVQRPDLQRGAYLGTIPSVDNSVVTSGVYERYFQQNGNHYHHLLDRTTGYPAETGLDGVVIVAENSMLADGYSTAVFVLGLNAGMKLVEQTREIEAVFILEDKSIYLSSGIKNTFVLMDEEYHLAEFSE